ncbi:MAG: transcription termination/antitermination protein NusG [Candidatus Omnitrophota bacterium]
MANWYVLHIRRGQEKKVKSHLENLQAEFPEVIKRILLPMEQVTTMADGEKQSKSQYLMPGYLLLETESSEEIRPMVKNIPGVLDILGSDTQPTSLSEEEVANILSLIEERKEKPAPQFEFIKGERVEIRDGPFANFPGIVEEINAEKEKVKVSVSIFGRSTLVELDMWQVEKV